VFLGKLDPKHAKFPDLSARELLCQAPLIFLCVALGVFPFLVLDPLDASVAQLVEVLRGVGR
jgi:NADH:ubiquinone oxidoreductase subunit 4 (subunit M)